jgi:ribosomal protein L15
LGEIDKRYKEGEIVDAASLVKCGLIKGSTQVKILGDGALTKKLIFKIGDLSASAREKILKAGGEAPAKKEQAQGAAAAGSVENSEKQEITHG